MFSFYTYYIYILLFYIYHIYVLFILFNILFFNIKKHFTSNKFFIKMVNFIYKIYVYKMFTNLKI